MPSDSERDARQEELRIPEFRARVAGSNTWDGPSAKVRRIRGTVESAGGKLRFAIMYEPLKIRSDLAALGCAEVVELADTPS